MTDIHEVAALEALARLVRPSDRVYVYNHDYIGGSGEREVTDKTDGRIGLRSTDRGARSSWFGWPDERSDFEVDLARRVLRVYNPSHAYVHGGRAVVLTLSFGKGGPDRYRWCGVCQGRVAMSTHTAH